VYHHRSKYPEVPRHGLDFPIPQSQFISNLILPFLPLHNPDDAVQLQIKKTSWKTPKRFIKSLEKEGLLKSKDRKDETLVQEIEFDDLMVTHFKPYKLPKKDNSMAAAGNNRTAQSNSSPQDASIGQRLRMLVVSKPTERLAPLFPASGSSVKSFYLLSEIRSVVARYIETENLVTATDKRFVNINPIIANVVFDNQTALDREVLAKGTVPRDALTERIIQGCTPYWAILHNDESREDAKPKAGNPPTIKNLLETRSGNKTVTKVSGVDVFSIDPHLLADELQKACASSTSVGQLVGSSPKTPVMEVIVQGPQKDMVTKALEKRGVHRNWIEVLDKTKGKKK
jgi:translation initiation factor 2D